MWPWGHAALGYLLYTLVRRRRGAGAPSGWAVVALGVGTQFPDLVDKPLAWYLQVLPHGRTLAHTTFVAGPAVALVSWVGIRRGHREVAFAFALGYFSHLLGDALLGLTTGRWETLRFLTWPLASPPAGEVQTLPGHLRAIEGSPFTLVELLLTVATFGLWLLHGCPGVRELASLRQR